MPVPVQFAGGESGEAVEFDGKVLNAVSSGAFAPGMPLEFVVAPSGESLRLQGKSAGSRRLGEERFQVRIRLVNLRRADRERLLQMLRQ